MKKQTVDSRQKTGLWLVRAPVAAVEAEGVREGSTGRVVLARVWAVAEGQGSGIREQGLRAGGLGLVPESRPSVVPKSRPAPLPEMAFYRKYTEGLLRRYMRMSMSVGRVPSMMGREVFRGQVSSCRVTSFEDVVIFCYDVEKCLKVLNGQEQELIKRIALQSYSQGEACALVGISLRSCVRLYAAALDKLTQVLLDNRLLKPLESCQ
jgi:hypothetical protein